MNTGVKAVHGDHRRRQFTQLALPQMIVDGVVIRQKHLALARQRVFGVDTDIAGDRRQLGQVRDRAGDAGRPVAVDHQPRIALMDQRRVQLAAQMARHAQRADIPADVAFDLPWR